MDKTAIDAWFKRLSSDEKLDFVLRAQFAGNGAEASQEELEAYSYLKSNSSTAESRYLVEDCLDVLEIEEILELEFSEDGAISNSKLTHKGQRILNNGGWLTYAKERKEKQGIETDPIVFIDINEVKSRSRNYIVRTVIAALLGLGLILYFVYLNEKKHEEKAAPAVQNDSLNPSDDSLIPIITVDSSVNPPLIDTIYVTR